MNRKLAPVRGDVLVIGTYPPVPGHATAVTLAAVRRAYRAGYGVVVASPRHGAAHRTIRLDGPEAEGRLDQARQEHGVTRLVCCAEVGMPIGPGALRPGAMGKADRLLRSAPEKRQIDTVDALGRAMDRFDHVTVVVTGTLGVAAEVLARLWDHVDEVLYHGDLAVDRTPLAAELGLAAERLMDVASVDVASVDVAGVGVAGDGHPVWVPARGEVAHPEVEILQRALVVRSAAQAEAGRPPGVTLFGPPEVTLGERPRQAISVTARAVLGPAAPLVRRGAVKVLRTARSPSRS